MPNEIICPTCHGDGVLVVLTSQHDDAMETISCGDCNGGGVIYQMTEQEENDYWEDYW